MHLGMIFCIALGLSALSGAIFIPFAYRFGLLDKPNARKIHQGQVPLIGGLMIFFATIITFLLFLPNSHSLAAYYVAASLMVIIGVLDDKFDLKVRVRMLIQLMAASVLVFGAQVKISYLGNLFGYGQVELGSWGALFTLLAIMTAMNAYNMVDGIDGLLGSMSLIALIGMVILALRHQQLVTFKAAFIMAAALIPYLVLNLSQRQRYKIFMGDAGSMFIGLTIVWLLALSTQPILLETQATAVRPVAVLWLIAVPLMDMFATMSLRILKGHSPFKPDNNHLHHLIKKTGLSNRETLLVIIFIALALMGVGMMLEWYQVQENKVVTLYVGLFLTYVFIFKKTHSLNQLSTLITKL